MRREASETTSGAAPRVGWFTAACVLVSNVIGSGIFSTTGFLARDLGDPVLVLSLWLLGGLLALAGAMAYGELGAAMPQAGGDYIYLREAYGPLAAFLSGWASFTVGFGAAMAAAAMSFASYFLRIVPVAEDGGLAAKGLAVALVWILAAVHVAGVGPGGLVQRVLTSAKVTAILLLVIGGLAFGQGSWSHLAADDAAPAPGVGAVVVSLIFILYAYTGWNVAGYIAGEIAEPRRALPRIMIGGTLFVTGIYLVLNLLYFYALPVAELTAPPVLPVAEKAAAALLGRTGALLIAGMLCISIAGAVSAMAWAGPRVYLAMAQDGLLPQVFSETGRTTGVPGNAILLQAAWTTVLILSGTFEQLVIYSGVILASFSALAVGAVFVLRRHRPHLPRPYRVPGYPVTPALFVAACAVIVGDGLVERPSEAALAAATILAGVPLYLLWGRRAQAGSSASQTPS
ncbi:APC family permease [Nitrospira sp. Kam-Ns4a]